MTPVLVTSTTGSIEEAEKISSLLVEKKLAACVNIVGPVTSVYWWEGAVQKEEEYKLFIKSSSERFSSLLQEIKKHHGYSVPEVTAVPIKDLNPDYRRWMKEILG